MSGHVIVAALLGLLAVPAGADEAFLVKDIDTTGEPVFEPCYVTCPPGPAFYGGLPNQLTAWGDLVFFVASDRVHGFEPWVSDGTEAGTHMLADLVTGAVDSWAVMLGATPARALFWAIEEGSWQCRLWVSDGRRLRYGWRCRIWSSNRAAFQRHGT